MTTTHLPHVTYDESGEVFDLLGLDDLRSLADLLWRNSRNHPHFASCECPATEAVSGLIKLGYTITKKED